MQAAIWRTEEALELQRERVISQDDPELREIAKRGLSTLEDVLVLQTGMLEVLLRLHETCADMANLSGPSDQPRSTRS